MCIIKVDNASYTYLSKYQKVEALKSVSCTFDRGKLYAIIGHSGCGKSTMLSLLAGLDLPTSGDIFVEGTSTRAIDRDAYRQKTVSVVYQAFNLFPLFTALENVMYPLELNDVGVKEAKKRAEKLISDVGLGEKSYKQRPLMMSGGEQQRVAVARALASGGKIILADEPTGNLDTENGEKVMGIFRALAHDQNYTVVIVTHDMEIAATADVVYKMKDGQLSI